MRPAQSPSSPARLDEDHSKAETREGGPRIEPPRIKRGFRSAPSGTIERGAYKGKWRKRKVGPARRIAAAWRTGEYAPRRRKRRQWGRTSKNPTQAPTAARSALEGEA